MIRSITLAGMLLAILFIQEQLLVLVPQFQFTVVLIMVYACIFPYKILVPMILGYVLLDNIFMGTLNYLYFVPMVIAWVGFAIVAKTLRDKPFYIQVILAIAFGFVYGWIYLPARMIEQGVGIFWLYLKMDLPFEIMMAASNLITVLISYHPLRYSLEKSILHLE
ncbi:MAG: hypothetical protein RQ856_01730 [Candidatus Izemoplasmatales bacterium]|nr:hypothetical protein [Candidatus Izemoplasmatales bacterium]